MMQKAGPSPAMRGKVAEGRMRVAGEAEDVIGRRPVERLIASYRGLVVTKSVLRDPRNIQ